VLEYGESEYVREFGLTVSDKPLRTQARIINAPTLMYHQSSKQPDVKPHHGSWNLIGKRMIYPCQVPNWMVIIYERQVRFNEWAANRMVSDLVKACKAVGIRINPLPALVKWEAGQGNIGEQLRFAGAECQRCSGSLPTLIVVILPFGGNDIYSAVKHFGDVSVGVITQCMVSWKCFRAGPHYFANITLKLNAKLGGINAVPEPRDVPFLTDPANPTIVMGSDVMHPAPGSVDRPSFTSLVGSVDTSAVRYISTTGVQTSRKEIIEAMESMCTYLLAQFKEAVGVFPKRILFYRGGISEGQHTTVLEEELPLIRGACVKLGIKPTITFIIVEKRHHVRFFPSSPSEGDQSGNCFAGTVVDDVVNPVQSDFYLLSHRGGVGTSRPAHYIVLIDENKLTTDDVQSISYALCHVYAPATCSLSIPAPLHYANRVCSRAKNHYDPQQGLGLDLFDIEGQADALERHRRAFRPTHKHMKKLMYFC